MSVFSFHISCHLVDVICPGHGPRCGVGLAGLTARAGEQAVIGARIYSERIFKCVLLNL